MGIKIGFSVVIIGLALAVEYYARHGEGLSKEGKKFIRVAYVFVAGIALLSMWLS